METKHWTLPILAAGLTATPLMAHANEIHTEILIDAPPEIVWQVLTDTAHYDWNPFIRSFQGELTAGERIEVELQAPGQKAMTFKPKLLVVDENRELRWLGRIGVRGIFDGEHMFKLEETEDGKTRFIQAEHFRGVLVLVMGKKVVRDTTPGFEAMNEALKQEAEALATNGRGS